MPDNPESGQANQDRSPRTGEDVAQAGAAPGPDTDLRSGEEVTLELDAGVIAWFKEQDDDYETAINVALRQHMERRRSAT